MGFVSEVLGDIEGIRYFYIVGQFVFIGLFIHILIKTIRIPKKELDSIKTSILDNDEDLDQTLN